MDVIVRESVDVDFIFVGVSGYGFHFAGVG